MNERKKSTEIEKRKKKSEQLPGVPFDPLDNDYLKNKQLILPGTMQSTAGTFGGFGYNILNNPYCGPTDNPDSNDDYLYY